MRGALVWIPLLAVAVGATGCGSDGGNNGSGGSGGTASSGGSGGSGGSAASGGTGGAGGSSGSGASAGSGGATDAGSDAPPTVNCDPATEIQQPGTTLCWRLCPLEQAPDAGGCSGNVTITDWCNSSGVDSGHCTPSTPGTSLCETVLGAGYRLPTRAEWMALLGNCKALGVAKINYTCDKCSVSTSCSAMFPSDTGTYWASSGSNGNAYIAGPSAGDISLIASTGTYATRCVRDGT